MCFRHHNYVTPLISGPPWWFVQAPSEVMEWEDFKALYGREFEEEEDERRSQIYARTVEIIRRNNAEADASSDPNHVRLGVNDFSDMTKAEFSMLNTYQIANISEPVTILPPVDVSATVDWRTKGAVTPVKNQYRCGASCATRLPPLATAICSATLLPCAADTLTILRATDPQVGAGPLRPLP